MALMHLKSPGFGSWVGEPLEVASTNIEFFKIIHSGIVLFGVGFYGTKLSRAVPSGAVLSNPNRPHTYHLKFNFMNMSSLEMEIFCR